MESESGTKMNTINSEMNWVLQSHWEGRWGICCIMMKTTQNLKMIKSDTV